MKSKKVSERQQQIFIFNILYTCNKFITKFINFISSYHHYAIDISGMLDSHRQEYSDLLHNDLSIQSFRFLARGLFSLSLEDMKRTSMRIHL